MAKSRKLRNGLTPKQNAFTKVVVKQIVEKGEINLTQAALEVYDTNSAKSASVIASNNLGIVSVREQIDKALSSSGLGVDAIVDNMKNLACATPEKISADVVLKSNIELLKLHGAYPSTKHTQVNLSLRSQISSLSFAEAKERYEKLHSEINELLIDSEL